MAKDLLSLLIQKPFPELGKQVGHFPLYDSLLAGCANQALSGTPLPPKDIPIPDEATVAFVKMLRSKARLEKEEQYFLEYFDLLEKIRKLLAGE